MDEKERLKAQIKAYEYYAGLIERAVGGGAQPKLPRWDEQRALEYRELAAQLKQRLAELEAQEGTETPPAPSEPAPPPASEQPLTVTSGENNAAPAT